MKKCDVKGCRNKAEVFTRTGGLCQKHWDILRKEKEAQPKKIDVVEEMDKIERRESLAEGGSEP